MNSEFVNKLMCTEQCPCEGDHHDIIEDDIDESTLAKSFKRTWKEKKSGDLIPMVFGLDEGQKGREFGSFEDCYNEILKKKSPPNDMFKAAANNFEKQLKKMRYYEEEFECGGVCDLPLFYSTKPMADGLPEEDCIDAIIESELDNKLLGMINAGSGLVFIILGLASIPCGSKSKKKDKGGKHIEMAEEDPTPR